MADQEMDVQEDEQADEIAELPPPALLPDTAPLVYREEEEKGETRAADPTPDLPIAELPGRPVLSLVEPAEVPEKPAEPSAPAAETREERPAPEPKSKPEPESEPKSEPEPEPAPTAKDAKAALEGDAVPLWQRFAKEPGSEAPLAASPAPDASPSPAAEVSPDEPPVWPPHARPVDPAEQQPKKAAPLWRQFVQKKDDPQPAAASSPDAASSPATASSPDAARESVSPTGPPAPLPAAAAALASRPAASTPPAASLDQLERRVLGPKAAKKQSWFVRELFGGDEAAYAAALRHLDGVGSWDEAWKVIGAEVFRKHRVNIYGPAAVAFTDAVEARHKERAADA